MTDEEDIEYMMNGFNKFAKQCVERGITPERFTSTVTWLLAHDPSTTAAPCNSKEKQSIIKEFGLGNCPRPRNWFLKQVALAGAATTSPEGTP